MITGNGRMKYDYVNLLIRNYIMYDPGLSHSYNSYQDMDQGLKPSPHDYRGHPPTIIQEYYGMLDPRR